MHTKLKIIGCGGHLRVVIDALSLCEHAYEISLCDSNKELLNTVVCSFLVDSDIDSLSEFIGYVHVTIGNNKIRERIFNLFHHKAIPLSIIHPKAVISKAANIGLGTFVAAQAILAPDSAVGQGCIINHCAVVDHEVKIGDFTHVAPNSTLGGRVSIGSGVLVGAGSVVLPGINIGDNVIIAAGAVVINDIESNTTVKGVPAV